jgi:hypothetical protein
MKEKKVHRPILNKLNVQWWNWKNLILKEGPIKKPKSTDISLQNLWPWDQYHIKQTLKTIKKNYKSIKCQGIKIKKM